MNMTCWLGKELHFFWFGFYFCRNKFLVFDQQRADYFSQWCLLIGVVFNEKIKTKLVYFTVRANLALLIITETTTWNVSAIKNDSHQLGNVFNDNTAVALLPCTGYYKYKTDLFIQRVRVRVRVRINPNPNLNNNTKVRVSEGCGGAQLKSMLVETAECATPQTASES